MLIRDPAPTPPSRGQRKKREAEGDVADEARGPDDGARHDALPLHPHGFRHGEPVPRDGPHDRGHALKAQEATERGGFPCRHCLAPARPGEVVLLGSYDLPRPRGLYWTPSPIFIHRDPCPRFDRDNVVAPILRNSLVSVRAYDTQDMCLYHLGQVCPGDAIELPLADALAAPCTAFVNVHTARPGCLLARVERMG